MYTTHFGLRCLPFEDRADTQFLFSTPEYEETLAAMEYEARYGKGIALILGEAGTGKTLLIRSLLLRLKTIDRAVVLTCPPNGTMDLVRECCKGFGVTLPSAPSTTRRLNRLRRHLERNVKAGCLSTLVVDQAENLSPEAFSDLSALTDLNGERGRLLSVVLSGQPRLRTQLFQPEHARLRQRLFGERTVMPLTPSETEAYVIHRLRVAGAVDDGVFDAKSMALIHEASGGVPRMIHQIANAAMLAAFGAGRRRIDAGMVSEVTHGKVLRQRTADAAFIQASSEITARAAVPMSAAVESPFAPMAITSDRRDWNWTTGSSLNHLDATEEAAPDDPTGAAIVDGAACGISSTRVGASAATAFDATISTLSEEDIVLQCERLEQTLARAERINTTSEATLAQIQAVEKHVQTLADRAIKVSAKLDGSVQQGLSAAGDVNTRIDRALMELDRRAAAIEARVSRAVALASQADTQAQQSQALTEQAEGVETRLTGLAEQLADRAEEVQERMAALLTRIQNAEETEARLQNVTVRAGSIGAEADTRAAVVETNLRRTLETAEKRFQGAAEEIQRKIQATIDRGCSEFQDAESRCRDVLGKFRVQSDTLVHAGKESLAEMERRHHSLTAEARTTMEKVERACKSTTEDIRTRQESAASKMEAIAASLERTHQESVEAAVASCRQKLEALDTEYRTRIRLSLESARERADQLRGDVEHSFATAEERASQFRADAEQFLRRGETAKGELEGINQALAKSVVAANALTQRVADADARITALAGKADRITAQAHDVVGPGEAILAEVRRASDQVQMLHGQVTHQLVEIGMGCEKVNVAHAQAKECERIAANFGQRAVDAAALDESIQRSLAKAEKIEPALRCLSCDAVKAAHELDAKLAATRDTVERMENSSQSYHFLVDQLTAAAIGAEQAGKNADAQADRLTVATELGSKYAERLETVSASAGQIHDALQNLATYADEKVGRLDSHHAAASHVLDRLGTATAAAHTTVERVESVQKTTEDQTHESQRRIERWTGEVWGLTGKAEKVAGQLASHVGEAATLIARFDALAGPATGPIAELRKLVADAHTASARISEGTQQAQKLAERVSAVTPLLASAKQTLTALSNIVAEAKSKQAELGRAGSSLEAQSTTMRELQALSQGLIESHEQLTLETESAVERVMAELASLDAAEKHMAYIDERTSGLRQAVDEIAAKVEGAESDLKELLASPTVVVDKARAQASQLETVCAAVRKVFASLSQASLDAKKTVDQLQDMTSGVDERISRIGQQTDRAATVLQQWVQEAATVQSRLEGSLRNAPSIFETHPTEELRRVANRLEPQARFTPAKNTAGLTLLPKAPTTASLPAKSPPRPDAKSKAQEISRAIEEASQRAAVGA